MILIVGATGSLGGKIALKLLNEGKSVRVLVRPGSNYQPLVDRGAKAVNGDLKDRASLDAACKGIDTVITTANSAARGGDDNTQTVEIEGNRNLVDAAKAAGVKQFIFVSALGANPNSPMPFMVGKAKAEQHLRESGLNHTILEPNLFMDIWLGPIVAAPIQAGRPVIIIGDGNRKHSLIAEADVAAFAVAAVDHPEARNKMLVIGGPEPLSWRDIVATYEQVLGRSLPLQHLKLGQPSPFPEFVAQLMTAMDTYDSPIDMKDLAQTFRVKQTSVEDFARRSMPANVKS